MGTTLTGTADRFGTMPDGKPVERFVLACDAGVSLTVITYGAIVTSIRTRDRHGRSGEVTLGYDDLAGYLRDRSYLGAVVGRSANRIAQSHVTLDGHPVRLSPNEGPHHLHGGPGGFHTRLWTPTLDQQSGVIRLNLSRVSEDGEEGYPGRVEVSVCYSLDDTGLITIRYRATTDATTIVNLTQHAYFNLAGRGTVLNHLLQLNADAFTPVNADLIPTGDVVAVAGTAFDFREASRIGVHLSANDPQLRLAGGYDHNWVLRGRASLGGAAVLTDPASGRRLEIATTEPGLQFYSGNFLDGLTRGHADQPLIEHAGLCLETQHFPDAPHHPHFPSTVLRCGEVYESTTTWMFSVTLLDVHRPMESADALSDRAANTSEPKRSGLDDAQNAAPAGFPMSTPIAEAIVLVLIFGSSELQGRLRSAGTTQGEGSRDGMGRRDEKTAGRVSSLTQW
jgi:aldose 1-epimerase